MTRHVLTPTERRDAHIRAMQIKRETMSPDEIDRAMRKTIGEALDARAAVEREDLLRANIPAAAIDAKFGTILKEVVAARGKGKMPVLSMNWDSSQ